MATDPVVLGQADLFGQVGQRKTSGIIFRTMNSGLFVRVAAMIASFAAHCSALAAGCRDGRQLATRYHELSQLSGAELARRGLTRQSIARFTLTDQHSNSGV
jgi:hypothetical protein